MLSINDIQTLLQPLIDGYFNANKDGKDISDIYAHLYEHLSQHYGDIIKDIVRTANKADAMYDPEKDSYLHDLSMISLLSVDIYAKKKYVEHLVDKLRLESEDEARVQAQKTQKYRKQRNNRLPPKVQTAGCRKVSKKPAEQTFRRQIIHIINKNAGTDMHEVPPQYALSVPAFFISDCRPSCQAAENSSFWRIPAHIHPCHSSKIC